jgi:tRNA-uridine 2-sulfurtransferase
LGIGGLSDPLYVVRLDPEARRVVVGPKAALATRTVPVREINWLGDTPFTAKLEWELEVKLRSTRPPAPAIIRPLSETMAEVELLTPEEGVSPGQACVFYDPDEQPCFWRRLDMEGRQLGKARLCPSLPCGPMGAPG